MSLFTWKSLLCLCGTFEELLRYIHNNFFRSRKKKFLFFAFNNGHRNIHQNENKNKQEKEIQVDQSETLEIEITSEQMKGTKQLHSVIVSKNTERTSEKKPLSFHIYGEKMEAFQIEFFFRLLCLRLPCLDNYYDFCTLAPPFFLSSSPPLALSFSVASPFPCRFSHVASPGRLHFVSFSRSMQISEFPTITLNPPSALHI